MRSLIEWSHMQPTMTQNDWMHITKDDLNITVAKPTIHTLPLTPLKAEHNLLQQIKELKAALQSQAQQHSESVEAIKQQHSESIEAL